MGLGSRRTGSKHSTVASQRTAGVNVSDYWEFQPGQKVMTCDGLPGVVSSVDDGGKMDSNYNVVLDQGMGGGQYTAGQLSPMHAPTASLEATAAEDYPELAEILVERPDIARDHYLGSKKERVFINDVEQEQVSTMAEAGPGKFAVLASGPHDDEYEQEPHPHTCPTCDGRGAMENGEECMDCEGSGTQVPARQFHDPRNASFDPYAMVTEASTDPDFRFQITASWQDVQAKAKRIRKDGGVRVVSVKKDQITAEVKGEHHTYESQLQYVIGGFKVAKWDCGCKWAAYSWGRRGYWKKFEGRMCSHALALQYEASSRGMFGREVKEDTGLYFQKQHQPVVIEFDKAKDKNLTRRTVPPGNMKRTYSTLTTMADMDLHSPVSLLMAHAIKIDGESPSDVQFMLRTAGIKAQAWALPLEALPALMEGGGAAAGGEAAGAAGAAGEAGGGSSLTDALKNMPSGGGGSNNDSSSDDGGDAGTSGGDPASSGSGPSGGDGGVNSLVPGNGRSLNFENDSDKTAAVNNAWGEPEANISAEPKPLGATTPHDPNENPADSGWASSPDPKSWNQPMLLHNETDGGMSAMSAFDDSMFEADGDTPESDKVALLHPEPVAAIPSTDGADEGVDQNDMSYNTKTRSSINDPEMAAGGQSILGAKSTAEIIAEFQKSAGHLAGGGEPAGDIAAAAREFLSKEAVRDFSPAERTMLIGEGDGSRARNLDRLDVEGTHYAHIPDDEEDDGWLS